MKTIVEMVEVRGRTEDQMLLSHFNATLDKGTYFVSAEGLQKENS